MPSTSKTGLKPTLALLLALLPACFGLAACGGSSSSSSSSAAATASTSSTATTTAAPNGARTANRFTALRACLQKNGITLPQRTPGAGGGLLGGGPGGPQLPKGVTRAQFQAAMSKCGGGRPFAGATGFRNPVFRQALVRFAACMRQNGVNVPTPNTAGTGPVFSTKGLNTTSKTFIAAEAKCRSALLGAFRRVPPGAGASPGTTGGPTSR